MTTQENSQFIRTIGIGGVAGDGIREAGLHLAEFFNTLGYQSFLSFTYPSLIKGGHNFSRLSFSREKIWNDYSELDVLIALNAESVFLHLHELKKDALIFVEQSYLSELKEVTANIIPFPFSALAKEINARPVARTTVGVGALAYVLGFTVEKTADIIFSLFQDVGSEVNATLAKNGYHLAENIAIPKWQEFVTEIEKPQNNIEVIDGNKASGKGLLAAGLDFYIAYPMTPSTTVLHFLAKESLTGKLKTIQPEDEIAAINMAIGVAYSGKKVAVGTATGGFALMQEAFSFAGISETPIVAIVSQRQGPATGVPTNTSQADLQFILHSGHGEFPRIVIAPGDPEEAYLAAGNSLELSWKYQIPSIVLLDKHLSESSQTVILNDSKIIRKEYKTWDSEGDYQRYRITEDGVSPLIFPGKKDASVKLTSYEHDEFGIATEDIDLVKKMTEKRFKKGEMLAKELSLYETVKIYGDPSSDIAIIFWGSTKGAILEAAKKITKPLKLIQIVWMEPFDIERVLSSLVGVSKIINIEGNHNSQLAALLREKTGIIPNHKINRYDSKPFDPTELAEEIEKLLTN